MRRHGQKMVTKREAQIIQNEVRKRNEQNKQSKQRSRTEQSASAAGSIAFTDGTLRDVNNTNQLAPAPAAQETGEWRVQRTLNHGCRIVDNDNRPIAAYTRDEDVAAQIVRDHNEHQSLSAERERLVEALKGVAIMLNTELERYDAEPWAQRVRAALNEQGKESG